MAWWRLDARVASRTTAVGGALIVLLALLAARSVAAMPRATPWLVTLDVVVGLAYVVAAVAAPASRAARGWIGSVGVAWLVGSSLPIASGLHRGVLLLAIVTFPTGRPGVPWFGVWLALAGAVALPALPQAAIASVFAVAATAMIVDWGDRGGGWFPAVAAGGVAGAVLVSLASSRLRGQAFGPHDALVLYHAVLLATAAAFPLAVAAERRAVRRGVDDLLAGHRADGLDGIAAVLGRAVGDRDATVHAWRDDVGGYVDGDGQLVTVDSSDRHWLHVEEAGRHVAVVGHGSPALQDRATREAVSEAVRLAVAHLRLREEEDRQAVELEASRARLVVAADRARARVAEDLSVHVEPSLRAALREVGEVVGANGTPAEEVVALVLGELAAASSDIADVVADAAPTRLGAGRLHAALRGLATRGPVPVEVRATEDAIAGADIETALFYVCAEALTNVARHAHATTVRVDLERRDGDLMLTVSDDGRGGADTTGSGLLGLADRLAVHGGRLRVEARTGGGTALIATVPRGPAS